MARSNPLHGRERACSTVRPPTEPVPSAANMLAVTRRHGARRGRGEGVAEPCTMRTRRLQTRTCGACRARRLGECGAFKIAPRRFDVPSGGDRPYAVGPCRAAEAIAAAIASAVPHHSAAVCGASGEAGDGRCRHIETIVDHVWTVRIASRGSEGLALGRSASRGPTVTAEMFRTSNAVLHDEAPGGVGAASHSSMPLEAAGASTCRRVHGVSPNGDVTASCADEVFRSGRVEHCSPNARRR